MMGKNLKKFLYIGAILAVGACSSSSVEKAEGHPYDGVWLGNLALSIGNTTCLRRENFTLTIEYSNISGRMKKIKYNTSFKGEIDKDGQFVNAKILLGTEKRDAVFLGSLEGATGQGTWKSQYCSGKWSLRKLR